MSWSDIFHATAERHDGVTPELRVAHALASLHDAWREAEARIVHKLAEASDDAWLFQEG